MSSDVDSSVRCFYVSTSYLRTLTRESRYLVDIFYVFLLDSYSCSQRHHVTALVRHAMCTVQRI